MDCFHYPLDTETLLRKKRRLRRELLAQNPHPLRKKIAILGGSTTNEVADQLGLFLLQYGIEAEFYQSEYAQYWQDAMFGTPELDEFPPRHHLHPHQLAQPDRPAHHRRQRSRYRRDAGRPVHSFRDDVAGIGGQVRLPGHPKQL